MRPILFKWRSIIVQSYKAMLYLGLIAGVVGGNAAAHVAGIDAFRTFVATLVLITPALLGARLFYVSTHWKLFRHNLGSIWNQTDGGAAMYGGLPLALLVSVPLLAALRLPFGAFWDVAGITILTGMIFARVGCLLNGCCAGRVSSSWITAYLPNHAGVWERRIPTQSLEAAWALLLLVSSVAIWRWLTFPGELFMFVAAGYSSGRLVLESTRERPRGAARFTIHHAFSLVLLVSSLILFALYHPSRHHPASSSTQPIQDSGLRYVAAKTLLVEMVIRWPMI